MAQRQFLVDIDLNNVAKVINSMAPTAAGDLTTKGYVDELLNGMTWKASARVSPSANINLAAPGATVDGVTMTTSDRLFLKSQTLPAQNGVYVYNGPSTPLTRSSDANTSVKLQGMAIRVTEGTSSADTSWLIVTDSITIDTTALTFTQLGASAAAATEVIPGVAEIATQAETNAGSDDIRFITPLKLANWSRRALANGLTIGDGSATSYSITHNWNDRDYLIVVYRNSGNFDEVETEKQRGLNSATLVFNSPPALNSFRVHVQRNQ
jgi:hypothetical protein